MKNTLLRYPGGKRKLVSKIVPRIFEQCDGDKEIRYNAAKALKRLTQQTFGRQPEDWRKLPVSLCKDARRDWDGWWQQNKHRYPRGTDAQE